MSVSSPSTAARLGAFVRRELGPDPGRTRALGRTLVGLVLATAVVQIFQAPNGYWTVNFVLLVCSPAVGSSERNALGRVLVSVVGAGAAVLLILGVYDLPWLYVPLQALGIGLALFLARATPLGALAFTGGATFAVISGGTREVGAAGLIGLAWYRLLQAIAGSTLGALVQLTLWRDDPLDELRRSLRAELAAIESGGAGRALLDPGRVSRHFELLSNAEVRHPALARRRAELSLLALETAHLVDQSLRPPYSTEDAGVRSALVVEACGRLRRSHSANPFEPPPTPEPPPRPAAWPGALSPAMRPILRASLKTALSAFASLAIVDAMQLPVVGALFACLILGQQMSTGTDLSKPLTILAGLGLAMGVTLVVSRLFAPNVDDFGSYLVVVALAMAPSASAVVGGPRVRNAGQLATVLLAVGLFQDYRPSTNLLPSAIFLVSVGIGCAIVTGVDLAVWPVSRERAALRRVIIVMRSAAELMADLDPRVVLAPNADPRWSIHRHLHILADLRGETAPEPDTPAFARDEEVLRLAVETQRLVVARVEQARLELGGRAARADTAGERRTWAANLRARADAIERDGDVLGAAPPSPHA